MDSKISPKKRKSLSNKAGTPAKMGKIEKPSPKAKTPKQENTPAKKKVKQANKTEETNEQNVTPKMNGSPKKQKLQKFEGVKSLTEDKSGKTNTPAAQKEGSKNRHRRLIAKMKEVENTEGPEVAIKNLNTKIDSILSRPDVTKTGKKKIKYYKHLIKKLGGEVTSSVETEKQIKALQSTGNSKKKPEKPVKNAKNNVEKPAPKPKNKKEKETVEEESSDDEDEDVELGEDDSDVDEEESDEEESDADEDDDNSGEEEEESDDEETPEPKPEKKKEIKKEQNSKPEDKKTRHVLFIGNLAYTTTKEELKQHFSKVGEVIDVRIPTDKLSSKPRGFAYLELSDKAAFQKALELNGSQLNNRRIKVEFQDGPKKNNNNSFNNKQQKPFNNKNKNFKKGGGKKFGK